MRLPALMVGLCLVGTLLAFPYLYLDARASNLVGKSLSLSRKREQLLQENNELLYRITQCQSLDRIEKRAQELGLKPSAEVRILPVDYGQYQEEIPPKDPVTAVSEGLSSGWSRFGHWWTQRWSGIKAWFAPAEAERRNEPGASGSRGQEPHRNP
jgi:hypothetical protein